MNRVVVVRKRDHRQHSKEEVSLTVIVVMATAVIPNNGRHPQSVETCDLHVVHRAITVFVKDSYTIMTRHHSIKDTSQIDIYLYFVKSKTSVGSICFVYYGMFRIYIRNGRIYMTSMAWYLFYHRRHETCQYGLSARSP
jgi:hypothetical protein